MALRSRAFPFIRCKFHYFFQDLRSLEFFDTNNTNFTKRTE